MGKKCGGFSRWLGDLFGGSKFMAYHGFLEEGFWLDNLMAWDQPWIRAFRCFPYSWCVSNIHERPNIGVIKNIKTHNYFSIHIWTSKIFISAGFCEFCHQKVSSGTADDTKGTGMALSLTGTSSNAWKAAKWWQAFLKDMDIQRYIIIYIHTVYIYIIYIYIIYFFLYLCNSEGLSSSRSFM